ncbi:MAG: alkaline phosphatase [Elusimicrobia bacterium]|nr:alkaline phosphatase [Elusimicrobiota bacterium]
MKKIFLILSLTVLFSINIYAEKIKYVFLFIGDGMSMSSEFALSKFLYGKDKLLFWNKFPVQTYMETWSMDSYEGEYDKNNFDSEKGYNTEVAGIVPYPYYKTEESEQYFRDSIPTDSAAAATAFSTGQKVHNWGLCYDADKDEFISNITDKLNKKKEYNVALITTDKFYSATPAGFSSHNDSRDNGKEIAVEILSKTKPEIVAGKNSFAEMTTFAALNNYYLLDSSEINKPQVFDLVNKKIFLELKNYYEPMPQEDFTLEEFKYRNENNKFSNIVLYLTKILLQKKKPFFALIEVAGIDKANHSNLYGKMLGSMYELNETVKRVYDLIDSKSTDMTFDNTLIIVTADHSTGMLRFRKDMKKGELPFIYTKKKDEIKNKNKIIIRSNDKIKYQSKNHTNELVGCYSVGAGSNLFKKYINEKNIIDNTDINKILNEILIDNN